MQNPTCALDRTRYPRAQLIENLAAGSSLHPIFKLAELPGGDARARRVLVRFARTGLVDWVRGDLVHDKPAAETAYVCPVVELSDHRK